LNKGKADIFEMIRPLVEGGGEAAAPGGAGAEPIQRSAPARAQTPNGAAAAEEPLFAEVRTLALHVPAPSPLFPFDANQWRASEQYRVLRTKIGQHPKQPRLIVVSSPAPGDGKSVSAINLAATLSLKSEGRALLLDADFRKSAIHPQLGLPATPGLAEVLRGDCSAEEALVNTREFPNLYVMCAGNPPMNPVELLDSSPWPALCAKLRGLFRYVVVDSPPVAAVADFDLIQAPCDGVILVLRPDHTNRPLLRKSLEIVPKPKLLGVLLNCVPEWSLAKDSSADYYYYSKGSGPRKVEATGPQAR
jgi:capsular exopolysaccharide synthesis family protein